MAETDRLRSYAEDARQMQVEARRLTAELIQQDRILGSAENTDEVNLRDKYRIGQQR